jgi:NADPH:quinone reductase-like Zn-dependent oxidoreductase
MKAAVFRDYGPPENVKIEQLPRPRPGPGEVLVLVRATTVSSGDARIRALNVPRGFGPMVRLFFGVFSPRIHVLGMSAVGEVAEVGADVKDWKPGDRVFAVSPKFGAHAEYLLVPRKGVLAPLPAEIPFEKAAAISFGGTTALHFLELAELKAGESILINGGSGAVGAAAIQLAKARDARVTAICSAANAELVKSLGADEVVDYKTQTVPPTGASFDVIMDTVGNLDLDRSVDAATEGGRLALIVADLRTTVFGHGRAKKLGKKVITGVANETVAYLKLLTRLTLEGKFRPVIDTTLPLDQIVEAHRLVDSGHKRGNVVVECA